ncbi:hypothetical protein ANCCAN_07166 [Ancylostoma caninum]|uniref:Uncharacterized protein n=1 Tax=Ancylostoma caninum TaxID=29170 RepID=A0A368GV53_ANCCA|nr:hypothetical protein ANCCAN_07166 [Ancylostoma caninum]
MTIRKPNLKERSYGSSVSCAPNNFINAANEDLWMPAHQCFGAPLTYLHPNAWERNVYGVHIRCAQAEQLQAASMLAPY